MNELGKWLKRLRAENNLTQEAMAWRVKMSIRGYQKVELGISLPNLATLRRLLQTFQYALLTCKGGEVLRILGVPLAIEGNDEEGEA